MGSAAEGKGGLPALLQWAIGAAWLVAILAWTKGWGGTLGHDHLIERGPGLGPALGLFLVGWLVMVAAMMLPSSLAAFRWFDGLTIGRKDRHSLGTAFLAGYVAVWMGFGALAFLGDLGFHRFVDGWPWLAARPWLIGGSALALGGAFELSPLAGRCGRRDAQPTLPLGGQRLVNGAAIRLGADHGLGRLSRCWALMLLSFAVGMASLGWMAALTLLMILQERKGGRRAAVLIGMPLLAAAALVIAHPDGCHPCPQVSRLSYGGADSVMRTATEIAGFIGVGLAGAAYVPQIWHLVRQHCSAGVSRIAFVVWLVASLLVTTRAIAMRADVFVVLGAVQIVATTVILFCATKYSSSYCASHVPLGLDLGTETESKILGDEVPSASIVARSEEVSSMCLTCGCLLPHEDHGNPEYLTIEGLERSAALNGYDLDTALQNLMKTVDVAKKETEHNHR